MFELLSGTRRGGARGSTVSMLISTAAHAIVVGAVIAGSIVYVSSDLPEVPDVLAFVAPTVAPPPPPPPPPPPAAKTAPKPKTVKAVRPAVQPAPVTPPSEIADEPEYVDLGSEEGVPGGIEDGVPGGVVGGIVGGIVPATVIPPPPPPPPPVVRAPVRVGGAITAPALLQRVEPEYPEIAVNALVQGVVILEATVGRDGRVEQVRVLRSIPLLDNAAVRAVKQWRYSPLLLNGSPERFVLTVTLSFSLSS